ncbi:MAG: tRNA lysidine(34) synthetase TilS [bacterium]
MDRKSFSAKIWSKIVRHSSEHRLFRDGSRLLLAVSGGPDSVCMAHFFIHYSKRHSMVPVLCHINHGIRGRKAEADSRFVERLGRKAGVETVIRKIAVPAAAKRLCISMEHAARKLRYGMLLKTARTKNCSSIATAHHLDDHAETVMLNLLRGTNPRGLLGIPVKRLAVNSKLKIQNSKPVVEIIRPLLCLTRSEIIKYLRLNRLPYRIDETNESEKYTRNWVRKKLLPLIERKQPRFKAHLLGISSNPQLALALQRIKPQ